MFIRVIVGVLSASVLFFHTSSALVAQRASTPASSSSLAIATTIYPGNATATGFPGVTRDNGGGGQLNGHNVIVFGDTQTPKHGPTGYSWKSNSYTYVPDTSNPLAVQDFGSGGHPELMVPWGEGESSATDPTDHGNWFIWPDNPLATHFNNGSDLEAYAVYGVGIRKPQTWYYNTLCKITANDTGLTVMRPVQKYITPDFKYQWGWAVASHTDGEVRLFAHSNHSLYIAKVPWDEMEDTSKFTYWDGTSWSAEEASAASIATGSFGSGDFFWSSHYNTWVTIFMSGAGSGATFFVSYSTSGQEQGPYTKAQKIFDPPWGKGINYGGHAYPQFFGTDAKDVLLSWAISGAYTQMAKVTFDP